MVLRRIDYSVCGGILNAWALYSNLTQISVRKRWFHLRILINATVQTVHYYKTAFLYGEIWMKNFVYIESVALVAIHGAR